MAKKAAFLYMQNTKDSSTPRLDNCEIDEYQIVTVSFTGRNNLYLLQLNDGWILLSNERWATPILASSSRGKFPKYEDMPDAMKSLMIYYENSMQFARDSLFNVYDKCLWDSITNNKFYSQSSINRSLPSSYVIVELSFVHWNQDGNNDENHSANCNKVYNKFCPTWYQPSCGHTYVGCTAVAMAIVMWYYKWPHSAIIPNTIDSLANVSSGSHIVKYNWDIMPTEIYNNSEMLVVDEVAGLLRDCGYASKMKYEQNGSGAGFDDAQDALENRFHYKSTTHRTRRWYIGNWVNKLKTEIYEQRPVIYAGYGSDGHAFVLFGYDTSNKFYINWGWGAGEHNYTSYSLDALEYNNSHIYNDDQEAIWGIEPDYPECDSYVIKNSDINGSIFEIYNGRTITAQNKTIPSNKSGVIYSQQEVRLLPPFSIQNGANVNIGIRDMGCNSSRQNQQQVPINKESSIKSNISSFFIVSPNPVKDRLKIETSEALSRISIYNLSGLCMMQTQQTEINVSALAAGMYIVQAATLNGKIVSDKFIKL
ncbi:MAG: C10 family peptidase [Paludibacteraceae bacterium]|nr:C10 family peptidase [Paludibacteraceae bacterium]